MGYKVQKPCRVCGKMYTPCAYCENDKSVFHWRTVACSLTCAKEYFRRIEESRKPKDNSIEVSNINSVVTENKDVDSSMESTDSKDVEVKTTRTRARKNKNNEESE